MDFAHWYAEASRDADGVPLREHYEARARKGNAEAIEWLKGPPFPDALSYLWTWALELHGRSGVGMAGLVPLTYGTLMHWAELTDQRPEPHEVRALMRLDAAMTTPISEPKDETKADDAWPEAKHG